jgi:hypothetical protein
MIATKSEIINEAFKHLRISGLTSAPEPSEIETALIRLESMAALFESRNICIGYIFEAAPDPDSLSGVKLEHKDLMTYNLAFRLAPDYGKQIQDLSIVTNQASATLSSASALTAKVKTRDYPDGFPLGSGNRRGSDLNRARFYEAQQAPISCDTNQLQLNTVKEYVIDYDDFLEDLITIDSFVIKVSDGLTLISSSNTTTTVTYKVKGDTAGFETVTISIVTTDSTPYYDDVKTINFNILSNLS